MNKLIVKEQKDTEGSSRRAFLPGLGGLALALPFLESIPTISALMMLVRLAIFCDRCRVFQLDLAGENYYNIAASKSAVVEYCALVNHPDKLHEITHQGYRFPNTINMERTYVAKMAEFALSLQGVNDPQTGQANTSFFIRK